MLQWTWGCKYLIELVFSFYSDKYPEVKLPDHMAVLFFSFLRNCNTVFHTDWTRLHSHLDCAKCSLFSHSCQHVLFSEGPAPCVHPREEENSRASHVSQSLGLKWIKLSLNIWGVFNLSNENKCVYYNQVRISVICVDRKVSTLIWYSLLLKLQLQYFSLRAECVSPKLHALKPENPWGSVWRQGLQEIINFKCSQKGW